MLYLMRGGCSSFGVVDLALILNRKKLWMWVLVGSSGAEGPSGFQWVPVGYVGSSRRNEQPGELPEGVGLFFLLKQPALVTTQEREGAAAMS